MEFAVAFLLLAFPALALAKIVPVSSYLKLEVNSGQLEQPKASVKQYVQIPITRNIFYYTPLQVQVPGNQAWSDSDSDSAPSYLSFEARTGNEAILLREEPDLSPYPGKTRYLKLQRNKIRHRHRKELSLRDPGYLVYDVVDSSYRNLDDLEIASIPHIKVIVAEENFHERIKRSRIFERLRSGGKSKDRDRGDKLKRVIHIPTLFIDPEMDGFENIFYKEMVTTALCLTSQPALDRHELMDEYEVLLCNNKGFGNLLNANANPSTLQRSKRQSASTAPPEGEDPPEYKEHDPEDTTWNMNKTSHDTLWKAERNGSTTPHPLGYDSGSSDGSSVDYDYEGTDGGPANETGWENDDIVEDPSGLDYMTWPPFLPDGVKDDDDLRRQYHSHKENMTMNYIEQNMLLGQEEISFEKRLFALNESNYLANYYEYFFKLYPYKMKPLLINFIDKRVKTLTKFQKSQLNSTTLRQLLVLFTMDVHHVNCFNRHLRFYGYMMKKPASINGDQITNDARLARGIIMRSLELIRHVPQYNTHRILLLRFLIASLKERASPSKKLTTIIGENDHTELYEVASYLEHLLKNGIHPDEINQDLFVQETRFYSHHFMNTLTL